MKKLAVIGVPSSAGARRIGQERAPQSFREAGFIDHLQSVGLEVIDFGDLPQVSFQPDQQNPKAQNLRLVVEVAKRVANKVEEMVRDNVVPLVLGGDCSIALGVLAGLLPHLPNLGLVYFDGDVDLNTPDTTVTGIFDGMVMAHMIGNGVDALARVGPRFPLMAEEDIVLFGYNTKTGGIDAVESQVLAQCQMMKYPLSQIRGKAKESAQEALSQLEDKTDSILVHFDVDVIDFDDFPAADLPHYQGLSFDEAMSALDTFIASPKFAGLVITEFNADRDADGMLAGRLVDAVAKALKKEGD
ncbi:MAG: arginase family protein [Planctomycetota bacterium]